MIKRQMTFVAFGCLALALKLYLFVTFKRVLFQTWVLTLMARSQSPTALTEFHLVAFTQ
uniref:Uncharacterized protein n=1 Tax=Anguilla anguilla TaxID=7936 RepID=A0A0E9R885_ANGAN